MLQDQQMHNSGFIFRDHFSFLSPEMGSARASTVQIFSDFLNYFSRLGVDKVKGVTELILAIKTHEIIPPADLHRL